MIHGYTFEKNGSFFTRITGFDEKIVTVMAEKYIRYDNNQIHGNAMFIHLTHDSRDAFYDDHNIIFVDSLEEFKFIAKIMY